MMLGSTPEAVDNMQNTFRTFWSAQTIQPKIAFDNVDFDNLNEDLTVTGLNAESFVLLQVIHATGEIAALATKMHRQIGILQVVVYADANSGRERAAGLVADQALRFLQAETIPNVRLRNPGMNEVGASGKWWQINVSAEFSYDINRS